ncbi:protein rolling stone [Drosophila erecta]|uniref:Uncharacterized protein n=1 Tax=Drosophila erecta TaxID=7220 RepID=B3N7W3_DROER|nr:protein rolling stone [Drosophila erecta]EDV58324.1 uncharacterized protein Dere_GG25323 [Drosophila erecta]
MSDPSTESCCLNLKAEFQTSKFSLYHEDPGVFCRSQWQKAERNLIWVLYRWALAAFFAAGVTGSMVQDFNGFQFIYLTDWGFTLCLFTCTYGAVIATIYYFNQSYFAPGHRALQMYWISHMELSMLITTVFWAALSSTMPEVAGELYNLWCHAFNSICMVFDCFVVAYPNRLMHFVYPLCVVLIFMVHSLIYYWAGGTDIDGNRFIYFALDWARPGLAIGFVCASLALICCFSLVAFGIYRLRISMYNCCSKKKEEVPTSKATPKESSPTV